MSEFTIVAGSHISGAHFNTELIRALTHSHQSSTTKARQSPHTIEKHNVAGKTTPETTRSKSNG